MTVRSLVRAPALHFLLAGALLFAMRSVAEQRRQTAADGATLSDDELLYREALALGVDRRDPAVRERLVRLGGFVGEERDERQAQEEEARRLGLERSDLVVHRHLAEMMRLAAGRLDAADYPTEGELAAYLAAHAGAFRAPPRVRSSSGRASCRRWTGSSTSATWPRLPGNRRPERRLPLPDADDQRSLLRARRAAMRWRARSALRSRSTWCRTCARTLSSDGRAAPVRS